jgi:hypothetical protein
MILGAEIGLAIMAIIALATGKLQLGKDRIVYGASARLLAIIGLLPLPVAFACAFTFGFVYGARGGMDVERIRVPLIVIEASCVIGMLALIYIFGWSIGRPARPPATEPAREARRRPRDEDEDDYRDRRPRRD